MNEEELVVSEEATIEEEVVEYTVDPETCEHNAGVNYCSGIRENGDACSHCAACGTQL